MPSLNIPFTIHICIRIHRFHVTVCIDLFSVPGPAGAKRWDALLVAGVATYSVCSGNCDWGKPNRICYKSKPIAAAKCFNVDIIHRSHMGQRSPSTRVTWIPRANKQHRSWDTEGRKE